MNKNETKGRVVTFTEDNVIEWQKELQGLLQQQAETNQKIGILNQRIQVVSNMFAEQAFREGKTPPQQSGLIVMPMFQHNIHNAPQFTSSKQQKSPPLSDVIMSLFPIGGEKLTKVQVKTSLKEKGINLGTNDAYFYTTMKRLVDKGDLHRDGNYYNRKVL